MKIKDITRKDWENVLTVISEGLAGHELNIDKNGSMTQDEFTRTEEITDIFIQDLLTIVKKNEGAIQ